MKRGIMGRLTVRQLLIVGIGGITSAFVLMGLGWVLSVSHMAQLKERLFTDARSLQSDQALEMGVLASQRENSSSGEPDALPPARAAHLIAQLRSGATSAEDGRIVEAIAARYQAWSTAASQAQREADASALLGAIREHRFLNTRQMQQTMEDGRQLEARVRQEMTLILPLAVGVLFVGGLEMWTRIFRPSLRLSQMAQAFGRGDLDARSAVVREDEMNDLCRTFNLMADAIRDREAERLRFVATVAHDLKNPLATIGLATDLMRRKEWSADKSEEWLGRIARNAQHMESIVSDLTDSVQAQTGQISLQPEKMDLAELAASVVREQDIAQGERAPHKPRHILRFEGEESCTILGDRKKLERVLVNLLSNAAKYSPAGSEVRVSLWRRGAGARLTVEDRGQGIAPQDLKRVFEPFTRLESTRRMAPGSGLGLVAVQKIVHAHGATIDLTSQLGRGTSVEILFPTLQDKAPTEIESAFDKPTDKPDKPAPEFIDGMTMRGAAARPST